MDVINGYLELEKELKKLLLLSDPKHEGPLGADAEDEHGILYELKTTTTNRHCSTARDVGIHTVDKWRQRHWIIVLGDKRNQKFYMSAMYYIPPIHMEDWFRKIEKKLMVDLTIWGKAAEILRETSLFSHEDFKRLDKVVTKRGCTLNDPKIPLTYIKEFGLLLEHPFDVSLRKHNKRFRKMLPRSYQSPLVKFLDYPDK